ncbi:alpha/beta hydrolase [Aliiruegeria lutimaris]|uniref:Acetyl esterase/lipase n=1 Tax=Aliiruegeria lutimaris TaxID=571298 RepID=A0A1G8XIP7_9RHOB|nr:alpha/beta hydrolase [Aliiruegeria lutimaris]SDJ90346.1 Acetyl esterase/lipase [Aliiruegeria lutimaris]
MAGDRGETGPLSLRLRVLNRVLRLVARPRLQATETPEEADEDLARFARFLARRPPYLLRLVSKGRPDIHWITAGPVAPRGVILHFHGGAYIAGSPVTHAGMLGQISRLSGLRVAAPAFRLAPAHRAPAQFEDALDAHARLLAIGYRPDEIILGGDSSGGGIALALLAELCRRGQPPAGLYALSPWVDLTLSGESLRRNAERDPLLPVSRSEDARGYALGQFPADDPRVSPLWAAFDAPPPVCLHVGTTEILLDDSLRMAAHLRACGGTVCLREWPEAPHVLAMFDGYVPEARKALEEVAHFIRALGGVRRAGGVSSVNR